MIYYAMLSWLLKNLRKDKSRHFSPVIEIPLQPHLVFDLSASNSDLHNIDKTNPEVFTPYLWNLLDQSNVRVAVWGYLEKRTIYKTNLFVDQEIPRDIHLWVDMRCAADTKVFALCDGVVHSCADNAHAGDYWPTIILKHITNGVVWHSLYGHLSRTSLDLVSDGMVVAAGQHIGYIGDYPENGNRPPHLHFQIIEDMQWKYADYPGVCRDLPDEKKYYATNCPDPSIVLGL